MFVSSLVLNGLFVIVYIDLFVLELERTEDNIFSIKVLVLV